MNSQTNLKKKIDEIYKECPKTLELIISRVSGIYDVAGVTVPLTNQLRDLARAAHIQTKGEAKAIVTPDICTLFVKMYTEVLSASFHKYLRYPKGDIDKDIKPLLLTFTDASQSTVVVAYMAFTDKAGKLLLHLIYAKGGLCSTNQTVPKRELQGMTNGAEAVKKNKK